MNWKQMVCVLVMMIIYNWLDEAVSVEYLLAAGAFLGFAYATAYDMLGRR